MTFESPLEELFAHNVDKYLRDDVTLKPQFEINTICGTFRLDFVLEQGPLRLGVECDGREFHDENRDEYRDAMILGTGDVADILRLRGQDMTYWLEDCLLILSRWYPGLFSDRGRGILERISSRFARAADVVIQGSWVTYGVPADPVGDPEGRRVRSSVKVTRVCRRWRELFDTVVGLGGGPLDDVIARHRAHWTAGMSTSHE